MHADCGGVLVNCFKQVLHLPGVVAGMSDARHVNVDPELKPWVNLRGLSKNPADKLIEEGRGECASLSNVEA